MAVIVAKLEGQDIPEGERRPGVEQVFRVTDADGAVHYRASDTQAAALAVELSEVQKQRRDRG